MIDPIEENRARLVAHPLRENPRKTVLREEGVDALEQEVLRLVAKRPVELIFHLGGRLFFVKRRCRHKPISWLIGETASHRRASFACAELDALGERKFPRKVNRVGL